MDTFDVIVVGAGPAGEVVAGRCADGGLEVAVVERELVGGECSYWGCVPSKTLIRPGDVLAAARRVPGAAEAVGDAIDVAAALAQRDYMTSNWSDEGQVSWLRDRGITVVRGTGRLDGERAVLVDDSADARARRLTARQAVVIASGTRPALPPVPGLADAQPWDNRDATAAKAVPRRLVVLGGGAIGAEIAQAFRRLGSEQVTVIEGAPRLLPREEQFAGQEVRAGLERDGVRVLVDTRAERVVRADPGGPVTVELATGAVTGDELLVATGRRIPTARLGLESVGLAAGQSLSVDERLRVDGVDGAWLYAIGDCTGLAQFTHMAKYQARVAADVILGKDARDQASADVVPRVVFTDPQVAAVGLTTAQAAERGLRVRTVSYPTGEVAGAYTTGNGVTGTSHLVIDANRRVVVGATFTGPGVQELLHSATIAIAGQVPLDRLWHAVPSFPTISEVWLRLLENYGL